MIGIRGRAATTGAIVMQLCAASAALELTLDLRAIDEAVLFGQSRVESIRRRFHEPYRVLVNAGDLDYIDVITPYRRVVLAAEEKVAIGDRMFGQRQALDLLAEAPQQIDLYLELTFNPLNTYVGVPAYRVALVPANGPPIQPRRLTPYSRYGPRVEDRPSVTPRPGAAVPSRPGRSEPLHGGTVIVSFDGRLLDPKGTYSVVISLGEKGEKEVARAKIDLATMR